MSNFQAIYLFSSIIVGIGTIRARKITMSSPLADHFVLLSQIGISPLVLILSCCFNNVRMGENNDSQD